MEKHSKDYNRITHDWGTEQLEDQNPCIEFVQTGGIRHGFNYNSLSWIMFDPGETHNSITIGFDEHTVTITGFKLEPVYQKILHRDILSIIEQGERYIALNNGGEPLISKISIEKKEED